MPQRCSVLLGIGIGVQDGCQARVFCNLMRPKSEPKKSAAFGGCDSRNNLMKGRSFPFLIRIPKFPQAGGGSPSMHFDCFLIEFNGRISHILAIKRYRPTQMVTPSSAAAPHCLNKIWAIQQPGLAPIKRVSDAMDGPLPSISDAMDPFQVYKPVVHSHVSSLPTNSHELAPHCLAEIWAI